MKDGLYSALVRPDGMGNRNLTRWAIAAIALVIAGAVALWVIRIVIGITVTLIKLGVIVAVALVALYVVRELYAGWSRAG